MVLSDKDIEELCQMYRELTDSGMSSSAAAVEVDRQMAAMIVERRNGRRRGWATFEEVNVELEKMGWAPAAKPAP